MVFLGVFDGFPRGCLVVLLGFFDGFPRVVWWFS